MWIYPKINAYVWFWLDEIVITTQTVYFILSIENATCLPNHYDYSMPPCIPCSWRINSSSKRSSLLFLYTIASTQPTHTLTPRHPSPKKRITLAFLHYFCCCCSHTIRWMDLDTICIRVAFCKMNKSLWPMENPYTVRLHILFSTITLKHSTHSNMNPNPKPNKCIEWWMKQK